MDVNSSNIFLDVYLTLAFSEGTPITHYWSSQINEKPSLVQS